MTQTRVVYFGQSLSIFDYLLLKQDVKIIAVFIPKLSENIHKEFLHRVLMANIEYFYVALPSQEIFEALPINLDLGVCAHFEIIPEQVLLQFRLGVINIHPAPLPKYAGRYPLIELCLAGDLESGVSIHWMSTRVDQGDLIAEANFIRHPIEGPVELEKRAEQYACHLLSELWSAIIDGYAPRHMQLRSPIKKANRSIPCPCQFDYLVDLLRAAQAYGPYGGMALYEPKYAVVVRIKDLRVLSFVSKSEKEIELNVSKNDRGFWGCTIENMSKANLRESVIQLEIKSNWILSCGSQVNRQSVNQTQVCFEASAHLLNEELKPLSQTKLKEVHYYFTDQSQKFLLSPLPKRINLQLP